MTGLVVDNSVVMSWAFDDATSEYADAVLDSLTSHTATVPEVWPLEVVNVLAVAERRGRLTESDGLRFLALIKTLPIEVAHETGKHSMAELLGFCREYGLSAYDASYLRVAIQHGLPLATEDRALRTAAGKAGLSIWHA